jgi:acetyl-CoA acetyltransferase family protein
MNNSLRRAAVIGGIRIPFARSNTAYVHVGNLDMLTAALAGLVDKYSLRGETIGEVAAGALIKHPRDWNLAREATLGSGLHPHTPAYDVQRACGTSLTTVIQMAHRIQMGEIDCAIAGGSDTVSDVPITYGRNLQRAVLDSGRGKTLGDRLKPWLRLRPSDLKPSVPGTAEARTGLSMGEHCELMAKEWSIGRREQDELANASHLKAAAAWKEGFFADLVVPYEGLTTDNNVRPDSTVEKLANLKPVFDRSATGTLTAGNSTPLTDGASCVLLASEAWADARGLPVQAYITQSAVAAVDYAGDERPPRGPADGADLRGAGDARSRGNHIAGFRHLRNPRSVRGASPVHVQGVGVRGVLPHQARARHAARHDRSREAQSQRKQRGRRPSVCGNGGAHRRHARQAARAARFGTGAALDLHRGRDGRHRDTRALTQRRRQYWTLSGFA